MIPKRTSRSKKILAVSTVLIVAGVMLMLYPPFTDAYAGYIQAKLRALYHGNGQAVEEPEEAAEEPAIVNPENEAVRTPAEFTGALLEIPALDLEAAVVKGTDSKALRQGPGWYEESALPGEGNTAIAAHRTTYGGWFRRLDELQAGDVIILGYGETTFRYEVEKVYVVASDDWSVIAPTETPALTLTTCHPIGSTKQRLVVRAGLTDADTKE